MTEMLWGHKASASKQKDLDRHAIVT
jgi:hypothetical protein